MYLWLDDVRPAPPGWVWARTADEAARALATGRVQVASLDHDLGEGLPTGQDLVRWMAAAGAWPKYKPSIHSANPLGAAAMIVLIQAHGPYQ